MPSAQTKPKPRVKYTSIKLGKSQYDLLLTLASAGTNGCTTAELQADNPDIHLRVIQDSVKRLNERGLVKKIGLKHNKNKWYYSEVASEFVAYWPALPPHAKASKQ